VTTEVTVGCDGLNYAYLLAFPLNTLAINRMANTVISRKPKHRLLSDLADMWRIGRW